MVCGDPNSNPSLLLPMHVHHCSPPIQCPLQHLTMIVSISIPITAKLHTLLLSLLPTWLTVWVYGIVDPHTCHFEIIWPFNDMLLICFYTMPTEWMWAWGFKLGVVINFKNNSDNWLNFELSDFKRLEQGYMTVLISQLGTCKSSSGVFDKIRNTSRHHSWEHILFFPLQTSKLIQHYLLITLPIHNLNFL